MNYNKGYNVYYRFTDQSVVPETAATTDFYKVALPITAERGPVNVITYIEDSATLKSLFGEYKDTFVDYSLKIAEDIIANGGRLLVYRVTDGSTGYKKQKYYVSNEGVLSFTNYDFDTAQATSAYVAGDSVFTEGAGDYDISETNTSESLTTKTTDKDATFGDYNEFLFTIRSFYPMYYTPFQVRVSPLDSADVSDILEDVNLTKDEIKQIYIKVDVLEYGSTRIYESYVGTMENYIDLNGDNQFIVEKINNKSNYIFINEYNDAGSNLRSYLNKLNTGGELVTNDFDNLTYGIKDAYIIGDSGLDLGITTTMEGVQAENIEDTFLSVPTTENIIYKANVPFLNLDYTKTSTFDTITFSNSSDATTVIATCDTSLLLDLVIRFDYSKFNDLKDAEISNFISTLSKSDVSFTITTDTSYTDEPFTGSTDLVFTFTGTYVSGTTTLSDYFADTPTVAITYDGETVTSIGISSIEGTTFGDFTLTKEILDMTVGTYSTTDTTVITDSVDVTGSSLVQTVTLASNLFVPGDVSTIWDTNYKYAYGTTDIVVYDTDGIRTLLSQADMLNLFRDKNLDYFILSDMVIKGSAYTTEWTALQENLNSLTIDRKDSLGINFTKNFSNDDVTEVYDEYQIDGTLDSGSDIVLDTVDSAFIAYYGGWGKDVVYGGKTIVKPLLGEYLGKIMGAVESNAAFIPAGIDNFGVNAVSKTLVQKVPDTRWNLFDKLRVNIPVTIKGYGNYMWFKNTTYRKNSDLKEVNNIFALIYMIKTFYPTLIKYIHKPYTDTLTGTNYVSNMVNELYTIIDGIIQAFAERPIISVVSTADDLDNGIIKLKLSIKFSKTIKYIDVEFVFERSGEYYANII